MRSRPLKTLNLILSLSKDEAQIQAFSAACYSARFSNARESQIDYHAFLRRWPEPRMADGRRYAIRGRIHQHAPCGKSACRGFRRGGLSTEAMQAIARESNLSETVFVLPPRLPAHTAHIASSALDRTAVCWPSDDRSGDPACRWQDFRSRRHCDAPIVLEEGIGSIRVGVVGRRGQAPYAEFDVPKLPELAGAPAMEDRIPAASASRRKRSALPTTSRPNMTRASPSLSFL